MRTILHRRDTENTEDAQRFSLRPLGVLCVSAVSVFKKAYLVVHHVKEA